MGEPEAQAKRTWASMTRKMDANNDGKVSLEEWCQFYMNSMKEANANKDDAIKFFQEMEKKMSTVQLLSSIFKRVDADHDGFLVENEGMWISIALNEDLMSDPAEAKKRWAPLAEAMDANKDGIISFEEWCQYYITTMKDGDEDQVTQVIGYLQLLDKSFDKQLRLARLLFEKVVMKDV